MKFLGVTILQGVEFSIFPIEFEWALQQCSATALPVIVPFVPDGYVTRSYVVSVPKLKEHYSKFLTL